MKVELSVEAVICVEFNNSVTLGIFRDAQTSLLDSKVVRPKIFFVKLGIAAVVDFGKGTMSVEQKLLRRRILDPNCHLTYGFALCYSFAGQPHGSD